MNSIALENLRLTSMASGAQAILLTEQVTWDEFFDYARAFAELFHVQVTAPASSGDTQVATIEIDGEPFWLAYDIWQNGVSLEPKDSAAAALVPGIYARLVKLRQHTLE